MAVQVVVPVVTQTIAIADICDPWWLYNGNGGISSGNCVFAYAPCGADSLSDSYINLNNPGTYNAAPGTAPSWAAATGWAFNGTTQYLTTGYTPPNVNMTFIVRYSDTIAEAGHTMAGFFHDTTDSFDMLPCDNQSYPNYNNAAFGFYGTPCATNGVMAFANRSCYHNGILVATLGTAGTLASAQIDIGRSSYGGGGRYWQGRIQAMALYSTVLDSDTIAALTIAMLAIHP